VSAPALASLAKPGRLSLPRRLALAAEVSVSYVRVRALLRRGDVASVVERLRAGAEDTRAVDAHTAGLRLARAVTLVLQRLPGDTRCLTMSLVLCAMLGRRGAGARVVVGVRPGTPFGAHAWAELGGRPLLPPLREEFERLVAL
jgi:Transglutaminase-like superfamily